MLYREHINLLRLVSFLYKCVDQCLFHSTMMRLFVAIAGIDTASKKYDVDETWQLKQLLYMLFIMCQWFL